MTEPFFLQADNIDKLLRQGPVRFKDLSPYLQDLQLQHYFFAKATDPSWLNELVKAGFYAFTGPFAEDSRITWERFGYLKRVAAEQEALTRDIILDLSKPQIVAHLTHIADLVMILPLPVAVSLIPRLVEAIIEAERLVEVDRVGTLIVHLAQKGEPKLGLELFEALLDLWPDSSIQEDEPFSLSPTPQTRLGSWEYKELLEQTVSILLKKAPQQTFVVICDLLERAVRASLRNPEMGDDHSTIWRSEISPYQEEYDADPRGSLVITVRDGAIDLATPQGTPLLWIIEHLEERRWPVFRRVTLYLLRKLQGYPEVVRQHLMEQRNFDASEIRPEYNALLKARFRELSFNDRATILEWIDEGPDTRPYRGYLQRVLKIADQQLEDEVGQFVRDWQRKFLALLRDQLEESEKASFGDLINEITEKDRFETKPTLTSWVGPRSEKMADVLEEMPVNALVRYLKDEYQPSEDFMGHSPEGLGRQLQKAVSEQPSRFADSAMMFADLAINPTFHVGLLRGFREALKEGGNFDWGPVVDLAGWLVEQKDDDARLYKGQVDQERFGFRSVRLALPDLFSEGFTSDSEPVPLNLRDKIWLSLERLTDDKDPDSSTQEKDHYDPMSIAINSVRTEALSAVIHYAGWIQHMLNIGELAGDAGEEVSEVLRVLDDHLDVNKDPSLAMRSVYGRWLPWIERLNHAWIEHNLALLLPKTPEQFKWYRAGWNSYLLYNIPYNSVFEVLKQEYEYAIEHLESVQLNGSVTPETRLTEHVMLYYIRGLISLDEPGNLIQLFYKHAPLPLRQYSFESLGRILRNEKGLKRGIAKRLTQLVDYRLKNTSEYSELETFGWWINSKALPSEWKVAVLQQLLSKVETLDPLRYVLKELAEFVDEFPEATLACFEAIVEKPKMTENIYMLKESTEKVLQSLIENSRDPDIVSRAQKLAHVYGSKGLWNLRRLVKAG